MLKISLSSKGANNKHRETSNIDFEDNLDVLWGYLLITITATPGFLEIHLLVQFCTKVWISKSGSPH
ncbi:unnamed protein product [Colletotrichum noveboracense]|uniref:Uncharacterized protein n=1 Tax=Colletotrichum noveboracense TaxID=2664923 RepID=A0A9W4RWC2_9PEZI|nr:unnamed protein product [Colletotrichum noveboracense]